MRNSLMLVQLVSLLLAVYSAPMNSNDDNLQSKHDVIVRKLDEFNKNLLLNVDYFNKTESLHSNCPSDACLSSSSSKGSSKTGTRSTGGEFELPDRQGDKMLLKAVKAENIRDAVTAIREFGADVNCLDSEKQTPLMWAMAHLNYAMTKKLLEHGADPNFPGPNGKGPLHGAVHFERIDFVKLLLRQPSINVNLADVDVFTPLADAIIEDQHGENSQIIQAILDSKRIDFTYRGTHGETYLTLATLNGNYGYLKMILSAASPEMRRFLFKTETIVSESEVNLDHSHNSPNEKIEKDVLYSPLQLAALNNRKDLVLLMLCNGAEPGLIKEYSRDGKHQISREIIQLLITPKLKIDDCVNHKISSDS